MKLSPMFLTLALAIALVAMGCASQTTHNLPPAQQLLEPGPGVGGPGPGVLPPVVSAPPMAVGGGGAMVPMMPMMGAAASMPATVQVMFARPEGMEIRHDVNGVGLFDSDPIVVPGRTNFHQGGIYRLKITNIDGREGLELYPTLEVGPTTPRTEAYLAHNAIPVELTEDDFLQVTSGNFVTKVIYLPDPDFQEMAVAGVEMLVSTRLDPGMDPIVEADRRGSIMAVLRLGNKDVEMPGADGAVNSAFTNGGAVVAPHPGGYPMLPNHIVGVTAPEYGMPYTGTPFGMVGPPHIPLGGPAGMKLHQMNNRTPMNIPDPNHEMKIHVRQQPGYSYPKMPSRVFIREQNIHAPIQYRQPPYHQNYRVN